MPLTPGLLKPLARWTAILAAALAPLALFAGKTRNVMLITTDGLRWQEVFTGADPELLSVTAGGFKNETRIKTYREKYWRETVEERRAALMPFFWGTLVRQGQLFGNQHKGSVARITNVHRFSYPGYNEMLVGWPDPGIMSNAAVPNRNVTVLEWLHHRPGFSGKVAVFSAWDVTAAIINRERAGFPVMAGWEPVPNSRPNARERLLNELIRDFSRANAPNELWDALIYQAGWEYLVANKPRLMMWGLLETDCWGHGGRYDLLLDSAHMTDAYIGRLWNALQAMPEYAGTTTFVITTDHGRGSGPVDWKNHGAAIAGAENIWMAVIGPDTPPLGERGQGENVTQSQVAATIAALLGEDYAGAESRAARPMADVLAPP